MQENCVLETIAPAIFTIFAVILANYVYGMIKAHDRKRKLLSITEKAVKERNDGMDWLQEHLNQSFKTQGPRMRKLSVKKHPIEIRRVPLNRLIQLLQNGTYTPVEVVRAYQQAAILAHSRTNCVNEFILEAEQIAQELHDRYGQSTDKPPLYGVPFSVKSCIPLAGHIFHHGYVQDIKGDRVRDDSAIVAAFRELGINDAIGIMAPNVEAINTLCRVIFSETMHKRDPYVLPMAFNEEMFQTEKPLNIGYHTNDGYFEPVPSCVRSVMKAKELLEQRGHTLLPFQPPNVTEAVRLCTSQVFTDKNLPLNDDIMETNHERIYRIFLRQTWQRNFFVNFQSLRQRQQSQWLTAKTSVELAEINESLGKYRQQFLRAWKEAGIDCLLCPASFSPALPHRVPAEMNLIFSYAVLYNVLDYPAGVVPCTEVTIADEAKCESYLVTDQWSRLARDANCFGSCGLPVGVQCVALPHREELCLRLMSEVENALRDTQ